jgi:hypothetical protein
LGAYKTIEICDCFDTHPTRRLADWVCFEVKFHDQVETLN